MFYILPKRYKTIVHTQIKKKNYIVHFVTINIEKKSKNKTKINK